MTNAIRSDKSERLTRAIYDAQVDLVELAQKERLTLTRLAHWANDLDTIAALDGLCRLNDARTQLLVSRYRTLAAARLIELARDDEGGELARKACVDLLRTSLVTGSGGDEGGRGAGHTGSGGAPLSPVDAEAIRLLLGDLGRETMQSIENPVTAAKSGPESNDPAAEAATE